MNSITTRHRFTYLSGAEYKGTQREHLSFSKVTIATGLSIPASGNYVSNSIISGWD